MSRAAKRRKARRWARYVNHYAHISDVHVGGESLYYVLWGPRAYTHVRRQVKRH